MTKYKIKLKHTLPVFLAVTLGTTFLYLLFRWLCTIQNHWFVINENILDYWLPSILPFIPVTIWLRPKLRILKLKDQDNLFLYQVIAWGTATAMMMTANHYLKTATGKLTIVKNIETLSPPYSRYISVKNIVLSQQHSSFHVDVRLSGEDDPTLNFNAYVVLPFKTSNKQNKHRYWYGLHFNDHISNAATQTAKERKYQAFVKKINQDIQQYNFSKPHYYSILQPSDDQKHFMKAIQKLKLSVPENQLVIITPEKGLYADRSGTSLPWAFGSFAIGVLVFLGAIYFAGYDAQEHKRQLKGVRAQPDDLVEILSYLIPRKGHFVSAILIDLNLLVFLAMMFSGEHVLSPTASELMAWGANRRLSVLQGEWWRLITSMFVHGGVLHLFFNIYGFVIAAIFIEPIFSRRNYFLLYLLSGIGGSLASIYWHPNTASVGASGAIFGLYGALLGLLFTSAFGKGEKKEVWLFIGPYVGLNLLFGMAGNIDNAAHIGGLLSGALFGVLLYKFANKKARKGSLSELAKIHKVFQFKGHPDLQTTPQDISKLVISIPQNKKPFIFQECFYDKGKQTKVINYIENVVGYYDYDQAGNLIKERYLNFYKKPDKGSLTGYKQFEYTQNRLSKETLYLVFDKKEYLQYEASKVYVGDLLIEDNYHLGEEVYSIQQTYDEAGNLIKVMFGEGEQTHTLKYNEEGYVVELIIFEPKQIYNKQVFSYQQGRLHKATEYAYLALDTMYNTSEEDIEAVLEHEYLYDAQGLISKETSTDLLNKQVMIKMVYKYE